MQNDPYIGAAQQSDTAFYAPVFWDGRLFCWVFNTLHVGDIGGVDPGGWAVNARDFFDESIAIPPLKLVEQGTVRWDVAEAYVRASREPDSILLNIKSALAGLRADPRADAGDGDGVRSRPRQGRDAQGMIADCSRRRRRAPGADPGRRVERAALRDRVDAGRGRRRTRR